MKRFIFLSAAFLLSTVAGAAERIEPGVVFVRPDGTKVRIAAETLLLDEADLASLDTLTRELEECREARDACERRQSDEMKPVRTWMYIALIAGAFAAGFCAEDHCGVFEGEFHPK